MPTFLLISFMNDPLQHNCEIPVVGGGEGCSNFTGNLQYYLRDILHNSININYESMSEMQTFKMSFHD